MDLTYLLLLPIMNNITSNLVSLVIFTYNFIIDFICSKMFLRVHILRNYYLADSLIWYFNESVYKKSKLYNNSVMDFSVNNKKWIQSIFYICANDYNDLYTIKYLNRYIIVKINKKHFSKSSRSYFGKDDPNVITIYTMFWNKDESFFEGFIHYIIDLHNKNNQVFRLYRSINDDIFTTSNPSEIYLPLE